jgi:hypothetical protein
VTGYDTGKQHKGDAQRNAANLYFPQIHTYCDDYRVEQGYMGH